MHTEGDGHDVGQLPHRRRVRLLSICLQAQLRHRFHMSAADATAYDRWR
jgi:hypothetical protein